MAKKSRSRSGNPAARGRPAPAKPTVAAAPAAAPRRYDPQLPEALPPDGAPYPQILRGCELPLVALVARGGLRAVALPADDRGGHPGGARRLLGRGRGGGGVTDFTRRALAFEIPAGMIAANLGIATLIPICWVLMAIVHQVRPRWLSSVQPRLRWRYLLICAGVALVVLNAVTLIPLALGSTDVTVAPQPGFWSLPGGDRPHLPPPGGGGGDLLPRLPDAGAGQPGGAPRVRGGGVGPDLRAHARGAEPGPVPQPARLRAARRECWSGGPAVWRRASVRT